MSKASERLAVAYAKFSWSGAGGAQISLTTLLDGLVDREEVNVHVYQSEPLNPNRIDSRYGASAADLRQIPVFMWTNQVAMRVQWRRYLRKAIEKFDPTALLTQGELGPASVDVADERDIPSFFFLRSLGVTGYEKYDPTLGSIRNFLRTDIGGKVQFPFLSRNHLEYKRALQNATVPIANSEFTAGCVRRRFGVDPAIIYPPIDISAYETERDPDGYVTMVNPRAAYKGADIVLDMAENSSEEFLLAGPISSADIKRRAGELPNVRHESWVDDMRQVYGRSKAVLVPSRYEEPFGRVAAETMVSGIPCVVSDRGGLPEVVGDTGVVVEEIESVDAWLHALERAFREHDPNAQKRRVRTEFSAERQIDRLQALWREHGKRIR